VKWSYDASAADNIGRNTPLVVDGVMYVDAGSKLFAVNAATGQLVWSGGNGWVFLRGDRQDPERFGVLELVG